MLHKPRGFITTMSDEMERKCVAELVQDYEKRVYPIGRLDRESEGLLLMTNTEEQLNRMASGILLEGRMTAPADVHVVRRDEGRVVLEIVLYEGRNRQIRKMCESLGLEIARLKRIAVGPVKLGMLPPGHWRELTPDEVHKLMRAAQMDLQT